LRVLGEGEKVVVRRFVPMETPNTNTRGEGEKKGLSKRLLYYQRKCPNPSADSKETRKKTNPGSRGRERSRAQTL